MESTGFVDRSEVLDRIFEERGDPGYFNVLLNELEQLVVHCNTLFGLVHPEGECSRAVGCEAAPHLKYLKDKLDLDLIPLIHKQAENDLQFAMRVEKMGLCSENKDYSKLFDKTEKAMLLERGTTSTSGDITPGLRMFYSTYYNRSTCLECPAYTELK